MRIKLKVIEQLLHKIKVTIPLDTSLYFELLIPPQTTAKRFVQEFMRRAAVCSGRTLFVVQHIKDQIQPQFPSTSDHVTGIHLRGSNKRIHTTPG
jgi:hypothetical protein